MKGGDTFMQGRYKQDIQIADNCANIKTIGNISIYYDGDDILAGLFRSAVLATLEQTKKTLEKKEGTNNEQD